MNLDLMAFFHKNNLPRTNDAAYIINFDDKNSKEAQWVSLFIDKTLAVYFNAFEIESISQEVLIKIRGKSFTHNIFRIQENESIMCGFYCVTFIGYMFSRKTLSDCTNLFSSNDYKRMANSYINILKMNMVEQSSIKFKIRKIDETRNYILDKTKHNDLISEE